MPYDENYYKTVNYVDYMSRQHRYEKSAEEIVSLLTKISLINRQSFILDYGCAVGFLTKGFHNLGFRNTYGYDISEWASGKAIKLVGSNNIFQEVPNSEWDLGVFLDVLEHMEEEEIEKVLHWNGFNSLVVRIPVSTDGGKTFSLDISNRDKTHINCKSADQWIELICGLSGLKKVFFLNLTTIYNTEGVFCALFTK